MPTEVHEIAPDIFRIASYDADAPITFVQFLIRDEKPLLYHTGSRRLYQETLAALSRVIDPLDLRYISWSHLESDECGATNDFLRVAPDAEPVHGAVGAMLGVSDFFDKPVLPMDDGAVLDLGKRKLRFLTTPHVPHAWDAIIAFEETTGTLFVSDLFTAFGRAEAVTESDLIEPSMAVLKQLPDYLPIGPHTGAVFDRLEALQPRLIAGHHSPAYAGNAVQALRDLRGELYKQAGLE
jgi:flavorubredoxin